MPIPPPVYNFVDARLEDTLDAESDALSIVIAEKYGFRPRPWQSLAIQHLRQKRDVLIKAGTGGGKSLVFQALSMTDPSAIVLVIVPTISVMMDQVPRDLFVRSNEAGEFSDPRGRCGHRGEQGHEKTRS